MFGLMIPDSQDAKDLEDVIVKASKNEASGAMVHAVMSRLFFISKNGWDKYCSEVLSKKDEQAT